MVAYNFRKEFADDVESGIKTSTIRKRARCKPGDKLQLYTGQRTKGCRLLCTANCILVQDVRIEGSNMEVNGRPVAAGDATRNEIEDRDNDIAKRDGFTGFIEMAEWFDRMYGLPFEGARIVWTLE